MDRPGYGIAKNLRLPDRNTKHSFYALIGTVEPVGPSSKAEKIDQPLGIDYNAAQSGNQDNCENNAFDHKRFSTAVNNEGSRIEPQDVTFFVRRVPGRAAIAGTKENTPTRGKIGRNSPWQFFGSLDAFECPC